MGWDTAAVVIAAVLGSSGLAGLLSGGIDVSRRSRLRRSILKSAELAKSMDEDGPARIAVEGVRDVESARLLALTVIGAPAIAGEMLRTILYGLFGVFAILFFTVPFLPDRPRVADTTPEHQAQAAAAAFQQGVDNVANVIGGLFLVAIVFVILNRSIRSRRARFTDLILAGRTRAEATATIRKADSKILRAKQREPHPTGPAESSSGEPDT